MLYRWKKNQERLAISLKDAFIPGEKVNYIVKDFSIVLAEIKYYLFWYLLCEQGAINKLLTPRMTNEAKWHH